MEATATITISDREVTSSTTAPHGDIFDMIDIVAGVLVGIGYSNHSIAKGFEKWLEEHDWEIPKSLENS